MTELERANLTVDLLKHSILAKQRLVGAHDQIDEAIAAFATGDNQGAKEALIATVSTMNNLRNLLMVTRDTFIALTEP